MSSHVCCIVPVSLLLLGCIDMASASRIASQVQQQQRGWDTGSIKAKLWTWNSGKLDLTTEGNVLSSTTLDADVLVTCQTEARASMKKFIGQNWELVAFAEHWGATGINVFGKDRNAQILSVFIRKPNNGAEVVVDASEVFGVMHGKKMGPEGSVTYQEDKSHAPITVLRTRTRVHGTDLKGKGGVSADLIWEATSKRPSSRISFLCVHLDSESPKARRAGLYDMLVDLRVSAKQDREDLKKILVGSGEEAPQACALWDDDDCPSSPMRFADPSQDGVVVLGDVNYRLASVGIEDFPEEMLLSEDGRRLLGANDRLNPDGHVPEPFVQNVSTGGFGFTCDQPFARYLPTYKRMGGKDGKSCKLLDKKTGSCGGVDQPICDDETVTLAKECYPKKVLKKQGRVAWKTKGDDLQLGWLDRVCYRATGLHTSLHMDGNVAWSDCPGANNKQSGSDHMPVAADLHIRIKGCLCPRLLEGIGLTTSAGASLCVGNWIEAGAEGSLKCPAGLPLQGGTETEEDAPSATIRCQDSGDLVVRMRASTTEVPMSQLRCGGAQLISDKGKRSNGARLRPVALVYSVAFCVVVQTLLSVSWS